MPERTMFYWSKMYTSQIKAGDTYDKLKKCITINIVDFICLKSDKVHSTFHLTEDEDRYKLTDVLEIHFLELPKIVSEDGFIEETDPVVQWMEFIDAKSKGVMEMLAEKNTKIRKAYDVLQIISKDENARMAYEAREAELRDQLTREKTARNKGKEEVAQKLLLMGMDINTIIEATELSEEKVLEIKNTIQH
jgi:predicted transposase/invertase (TIGR01784 family)